MKLIKKYWDDRPLMLIMFAALFFRIIAVIFSKGFAMHDDHFLVIEASQSWVDGFDYNNWLPSSGKTIPSGHSWFYVGLHYYFFLFLKFIGIVDPQIKMFFIRLIHALFSLIPVFLGFKITQKLYNLNTAKQVGLLLAILWFMPFFSVRNLVEIVCIPFMFIGIWKIVNAPDRKNILYQFFIAGFIMGLAVSIRFQTSIFICGVGLAILLQKKWKEAILFGLGAILSFVLLQGVIDYIIWGYPFAEFTEYVRYNLAHKYSYITGNWYNYIILILGITIPPVSIFLFFGFLRTWKKWLLIFLPTILFLAFHSYFPNKQERFILPIVPFIIMLGLIGWNEFYEKSKFWQKRKYLIKYSWIFFWIINLSLLPIISVTYSKKAKVEAMVYLSQYKDIDYLVIEDTNNSSAKRLPLYYLKQWCSYYEISKRMPIDVFPVQIINNIQNINKPKFVLFYEDKNLNKRVNAIKSIFPDLEYETTIDPGFIDKILYKLNPVNKNQSVYIYKINFN